MCVCDLCYLCCSQHTESFVRCGAEVFLCVAKLIPSLCVCPFVFLLMFVVLSYLLRIDDVGFFNVYIYCFVGLFCVVCCVLCLLVFVCVFWWLCYWWFVFFMNCGVRCVFCVWVFFSYCFRYHRHDSFFFVLFVLRVCECLCVVVVIVVCVRLICWSVCVARVVLFVLFCDVGCVCVSFFC